MSKLNSFSMGGINVVWLRRNLRLHDNPALHSALQNGQFMAIYIFDTTFPEMFAQSHHPLGFLLECLEDVNHSLMNVGGRLHVFRGCSLTILRFIHSQYKINSLNFVDDSEAIWHNRNMAIEALGLELGFRCISHVYHTLWNPLEIIQANGGTPPVTFQSFSEVAKRLGSPSLPLDHVRWEDVAFFNLYFPIYTESFTLFAHVPSLSDIGISNDIPATFRKRVLIGGESNALKYLEDRLKSEETAFRSMLYQPNQARPDIMGAPSSLSAAITFGAISIRLFYWKIHNLYERINRGKTPPRMDITGQLMWREYFYSMVRLNPFFNQIQNNPVCLAIPWRQDEAQLRRWKDGQTGYPFIDAGLRQLLQEGWIHHTVRTAVAMFLTRGDLWLNWEPGHRHFMKHLVDGDLSISAGNWMWLSSSAFDRVLDSSLCIDPVSFGKRLEPSGDYIRRYVPELAKFAEFEHIHEPWKAPIEVQRTAKCIIGKDYPERIVIHEEVSRRNQSWMKEFGQLVRETRKGHIPDHCHPSTPAELPNFFALHDEATYHQFLSSNLPILIKSTK